MKEDPDQATLFKVGKPKRRAPTNDELNLELPRAVKLAVSKRHRGRPPRGMSFDDLKQEVTLRALPKIVKFRQGGKFSLFEYCYVAASYALTDIQREHKIPTIDPDDDLPLIEYIEKCA